jgi:hypothetical protein
MTEQLIVAPTILPPVQIVLLTRSHRVTSSRSSEYVSHVSEGYNITKPSDLSKDTSMGYINVAAA